MSEESGFLVPWEGMHCGNCIYNCDYRQFEPSSSIAHISPIASSYDRCVLRWTFALDKCKYFCERLRLPQEDYLPLDRARSAITKLNDEVGHQLLAEFEQYQTPLHLHRLQKFLMAHGYQIDEGLQSFCINYYTNQPVRSYLLHRSDCWGKGCRQIMCTILALEFISQHNGCQLSDIEAYSDSVSWAKSVNWAKEDIKPQIKTLREKGFVTTSQKPRFMGGFDPATQVEITESGNNALDNLRQAAFGLLKFVREKKGCQMLELKEYWDENCSDVSRICGLLGWPNFSELDWRLLMVAPMAWKGYLEVEDKSPLESRFSDENMVRLTANGKQLSSATRFPDLKILYAPVEELKKPGAKDEEPKEEQVSDQATAPVTKVERKDLRAYPKGNVKEQLAMLLDEFLPIVPKQPWYQQPAIPSKQLRNAISKYAPEIAGDDVFFLGDTTFFGSAKKGLMLTTRGIYYNAETKGSITWEEIGGATYGEDYLKLLANKRGKLETVKVECGLIEEVRPALVQIINHMAELGKKTAD